MPWPGINWCDQDLRKELADNLEVQGIPTLIILDSNLSIITKEGRNLVNEDPEAKVRLNVLLRRHLKQYCFFLSFRILEFIKNTKHKL